MSAATELESAGNRLDMNCNTASGPNGGACSAVSVPGTTRLTIARLEERDFERWDAYVMNHPLASPFHLTAWRKSIEETFGYRAIYVMAIGEGRICGVLPLFLIQNMLVKKALLSIPFAVYGGVLADSHDAQCFLRDELVRLAEELQVQYVELRNAHPEQVLGFRSISRYVTFTQEIDRGEEAILESIPRKTRYMVRKSLKQGFETKILHARSDAFEEIYSRSLRRLGTPSFPNRYFASLLRHFGKQADIREVVLGGKVASAVLSFRFRDQILPYYGASDPAFNAVAPSNFMYYELMRWAGQNGFRTFDFGRSKKNVAGSYDFKSHWGMVEKELPYEMLLVKRKALPNFTPANPVFDVPRQLWQKLPLAVTRAIGPMLVRLVP